ncbi:D-glycero-beta-D-manno-heptose 1-phosphate adenylyltransferase [Terrabacter terrae]|uniref:D-glycero-beta-D-manno-heptose 1-phosphate adenylyltransferase n=1 Tax=Terrabacter terrae TaxID=318434 RepID=A0ABP5F7U5_9MICO
MTRTSRMTGMKGPLVVVGDALLDVDVEGHAGRLCPDAPVPVLDELVERARPGGAGLAAALAVRDGVEVVLVTALADDEGGERLRRLLAPVEVVALRPLGATPVKRRVRADGQSLVRLDTGGPPGGVGPATQRALDAVRGAGALLVSDYGRGTVDAPGLREAVAEVASRIPVVWDPHPRGGRPVPGARLVTPNEDEARVLVGREGLEVQGPPHSLVGVRRRAEALCRAWQAQGVAVTLGSRGALLTYGSGTPVLAPAPDVPSVDACGAGDRLAVSAAVALGGGVVIADAVAEGVRRSAEYVSSGGPACLDARDGLVPAWQALRVPGGDGASDPDTPTVVATGGCFDLLHTGHIETLRAARALGDRLVVCLNSDASVRRLKGPGRPIVPEADRARVLLALECVDEVVLFDEDTPIEVLRRVRPAIWTKGGDYAGADVPELAVLEEWDGQAVVLPYVEGRSTTALVAAANGQGAQPKAGAAPAAHRARTGRTDA